ncbi:unnamed protein product [Cylicocyclus nassatus]|uniref:Spermidine synthase n=1 Tax=Cylicocyclus nassatus TaxID=53992 RepID=A0AA36GXD4_CYLNA|nr:unnamed protein product [Cylicocyclus nassatus]
MLWCHLRSVLCVLAIAAVSGLRKSPPCSPTRECGPSYVAGGTRQPCTTKRKTTPPSPLTKFAKLYERTYGRQRVIDGPIRLMDGTRVKVADSPVYDEKGTYFIRYLFTNDIVITSMNLKAPTRLEASQLDSREWDPDHDSLDFTSYTTTMIEEMFTYGVVEISRNAAAKVLSIGLGTGYINSYLYKNYRKMNITVVEIDGVMLNISKKWFGLKLDNRQRVVIADGVEYVKRVAGAGKTFDVIHLDACTMDESAPVNCPINIFLAPDVVRSFSALLGPRGILVMNVMTMKSDHIAAAKLVKKAFEKLFKKCIGKYAPFSAPNIVMTCAQFDRPSGLKERYQRWKGYTTGE